MWHLFAIGPMKNFCQLVRVVALVAFAVAGSAYADDAKTSFARVVTDERDEPRALQLAIVTYVPQGGLTKFSVDLISAIHIGDDAYYANLNERFRDYDALLYELVAPQGAVVTPHAERRGFISNAQLLLTHALDLSFQLDEVDYTQPNFIHADLSSTELSKSMAERNESLYTYFWRVFFASMREYGKDPLGLRDWKILAAILTSEEDNTLKTMLAYELTDIERIQEVLGEDSDSAVIGARNERAIEVLHDQLDAGARRIGIFYGVGHMPDLEDRLLAIGLVPTTTTWVDAWLLGADTDE